LFEKQKDKMLNELARASRQGAPKNKLMKIKGRLHDAAIGAIYYAEIPNDTRPYILKTIDLNEQNVWAVTVHNKRTTLRGLEETKCLFLSSSKTEAKEWKGLWCGPEWTDRTDALLAKVAWIEAPKAYRVNEYLNEGLVGHILTRHVKLPHFVKSHDMWIDNATGFILQEYGGTSLSTSMIDMSLPEFKSIALQILITMSVCQDTLQFKHHDLHLDNIFVNKLKSTSIHDGKQLSTKKVWSYKLKKKNGSDVWLNIEHCGVLGKFGDYGLSSIVDPQSGKRVERVDYPLLDAAEFEWGAWNGLLEGQMSYDAVVFLSKFFMEDETSKCPKEIVDWCKMLYIQIKQSMPQIECSSIGRPFRNCEGSMRIADILCLNCFSEFVSEGPADGLVLHE